MKFLIENVELDNKVKWLKRKIKTLDDYGYKKGYSIVIKDQGIEDTIENHIARYKDDLANIYDNPEFLREDFRVWGQEECDDNNALAATAKALSKYLTENNITIDGIDYDVFDYEWTIVLKNIQGEDIEIVQEMINDDFGFESDIDDNDLYVDTAQEYEDEDGNILKRPTRDYLENKNTSKSHPIKETLDKLKSIIGYNNITESRHKELKEGQEGYAIGTPGMFFPPYYDSKEEALQVGIKYLKSPKLNINKDELFVIYYVVNNYNEEEWETIGYYDINSNEVDNYDEDVWENEERMILPKDTISESKNPLKDAQEFAKKRQKGLPTLSTLNPNAGNVEKGVEMFNAATDTGSVSLGEDLKEPSLDDIAKEIFVNGPSARGRAYPPFEKFAINEENIPDDMRYKEWDAYVSETDDNVIQLNYLTQGSFTAEDSDKFIAEVKRAFSDLANYKGYDKSFTVALNIKSRNGRDEGLLIYDLNINSDNSTNENFEVVKINIRDSLNKYDSENYQDLVNMYDALDLNNEEKSQLATLIHKDNGDNVYNYLNNLYKEKFLNKYNISEDVNYNIKQCDYCGKYFESDEVEDTDLGNLCDLCKHDIKYSNVDFDNPLTEDIKKYNKIWIEDESGDITSVKIKDLKINIGDKIINKDVFYDDVFVTGFDPDTNTIYLYETPDVEGGRDYSLDDIISVIEDGGQLISKE